TYFPHKLVNFTANLPPRAGAGLPIPSAGPGQGFDLLSGVRDLATKGFCQNRSPKWHCGELRGVVEVIISFHSPTGHATGCRIDFCHPAPGHAPWTCPWSQTGLCHSASEAIQSYATRALDIP
ncbi:hypothetical protein TNCV_2334711, partial [Trichonephila clavipes]